MAKKYMVFQANITTGTVYDLIEELDLHAKESPEDEVVLSWSSDGGSMSAMNILLDYIEDYPLDLTVKAFDGCASCGLLFLLETTREVEVCCTAVGMAHLVATGLYSLELRDKNSSSYIRYEQSKDIDEAIFDIYVRMGLSKEKLEVIKKGGDVSIPAKELTKYIQIYHAKRDIEETVFDIEQANIAYNGEIKGFANERKEYETIIKDCLKALVIIEEEQKNAERI